MTHSSRQFRLAAKRFSNLLSRDHSSVYIRHVIADEETRQAVQALIKTTYDAMSTPGSGVADVFGAADIAIAGSGQARARGRIEMNRPTTLLSPRRWQPLTGNGAVGETVAIDE